MIQKIIVAKKESVTVQLDGILLKQSRHLAVADEMSFSEWVGALISEELKRKSGLQGSAVRLTQ